MIFFSIKYKIRLEIKMKIAAADDSERIAIIA